MSSTWIPYSEREEWADVEPIAQDDGPNPVVAIKYSARFIDIMGYFRAIVALNEQSQRALELTADAIDANGANYTAWHYIMNITFVHTSHTILPTCIRSTLHRTICNLHPEDRIYVHT